VTSLPPSPVPAHGLDLRAILLVALQQFAPWLVSVLIVTWAGYPGVVCVTPLAWLLALRVGLGCVARSKSVEARRRLQEAALAGGVFGLLQGLLFLFIVPRMGPVQPSEQASATAIALAMMLFGILAGAGLSWFSAYLTEQRARA